MRTWAIRRARLSHDLVGNRLIQSLGAFERALQEGVIDAGDVYQALSEQLHRVEKQWRQIRREGQALSLTYVSEMTPTALFNEPPLCYCSTATRNWLSPLVEARWRANAQPEVRAAELRQRLTAVGSAITMLARQVRSRNLTEALRLVGEAREATSRLGKALSLFSDRVLL